MAARNRLRFIHGRDTGEVRASSASAASTSWITINAPDRRHSHGARSAPDSTCAATGRCASMSISDLLHPCAEGEVTESDIAHVRLGRRTSKSDSRRWPARGSRRDAHRRGVRMRATARDGPLGNPNQTARSVGTFASFKSTTSAGEPLRLIPSEAGDSRRRRDILGSRAKRHCSAPQSEHGLERGGRVQIMYGAERRQRSSARAYSSTTSDKVSA